MENWVYGCYCIGADFIASVVVALIAGISFRTRYNFDKRTVREMVLRIVALSVLVRIPVYVVLIIVYSLLATFVTGLGK